MRPHLRDPNLALISDSKHLGSPLEEEVTMAANPNDTRIYGDSDERPPWIEEVADPTWWDLAFGSYGDGYLEWVNDRYFWDPVEPRTIADTRSLWQHRASYAYPDDTWLAATLLGRDASAA
jgi:hypothetical protein